MRPWCGKLDTHPEAMQVTPDEFRRAGHELVEWIASYRERLAEGSLPVQSRLRPGELVERLSAAAPEQGQSFGEIMRDLDELIMPGITHCSIRASSAISPPAARSPRCSAT